MGKEVIIIKLDKEVVQKRAKKMFGEELQRYHDQTKKSAHVFASKKSYSRKKKYKEDLE